MMMPLDEDSYPYDSDSSAFAECDTVECQQRSENPPNMPDFGKRTLPVSGSRDLVKRDAVIGQDEAGDLIYQLQGENDGDNDDDGLHEDEVSDATEQVESQTPSALSARSLLGRTTDSVSELLRRGRKSKSSKKGKSKSSKKGKKSKSQGKGKKESSALQLGKGLIMKGATLLYVAPSQHEYEPRLTFFDEQYNHHLVYRSRPAQPLLRPKLSLDSYRRQSHYRCHAEMVCPSSLRRVHGDHYTRQGSQGEFRTVLLSAGARLMQYCL
jgi:hypothetical protein